MVKGPRKKKGIEWYIKQAKSPLGIIGPWGSGPGRLTVFKTKKKAQKIASKLNKKFGKQGYNFVVKKL